MPKSPATVAAGSGPGGVAVSLGPAPPYPIPGSATEVKGSLVQVFQQCGTGGNTVNATHCVYREILRPLVVCVWIDAVERFACHPHLLNRRLPAQSSRKPPCPKCQSSAASRPVGSTVG